MGTIIFIIVVVIVLSATIYYSLKKKTHCPNCKSNSIVLTGKKHYKEDPATKMKLLKSHQEQTSRPKELLNQDDQELYVPWHY